MDTNKPKEYSIDAIYGGKKSPTGSSSGSKEYSVSDIYGTQKEQPLSDSDLIQMSEGMPRTDKAKANPALARVRARFGASFDDTPFTSEPGDFWLTTKMGYADSEGAKRNILQKKYPQGDFRVYDMGEDGIVEVATKDGKTWHEVSGLEQGVSSVVNLENVAGAATGAGAGASLTAKVLKPAIGAAFGKAGDQLLKGFYDDEAEDPYQAATQSFITNALFGGVAEGIAGPLLRRSGLIAGSKGAEEALTAQESFFNKEGETVLEPLTKGQFTSNKVLQAQYKQVQNLYSTSREQALKRFQSLDKGLKSWIDEYGLGAFSKDEVDALATHAAMEVDKYLVDLSSGRSPFADIVPDLQNALDIFNSASREAKNKAYEDSFDSAVHNMVELDFDPVKKVFAEIEQGVPVQRAGEDPGISDSIGAVGAGDNGVIRYLTPNAKLQRMINKAKGVADVLSVHIKDGNYYGSLQQMNAIRREFSEFAWDNAETNQGRLATKVLDAIDQSIANPVSGYSDAYQAAFKNAQTQYANWRAIKEIKAISKLQAADPSTYQSYIVNLVKPGNGPLVELMDNMFKATPGAMAAVRNAYVDHLADNPATIERTLDTLKNKDPRLLNVLFPDKKDVDIIRKFGKDKVELDKSWFVKQTELEMLTEGQRALDLFSGNRDQAAKKVAEYLKYGGPNARDALQTATIHMLRESSRTQKEDLLGSPVIDADAFLSSIEKNRDLIGQIFTKDQLEKLTHLENYALKIKDTAVGVPSLASQPSGSDSGTSLVVAGYAASQGRAVERAESQGIGGAAKKLFTMWTSPYIVAKIINFDAPIKRRASPSGTRLTEDSLQSLLNYSRVAANVYTQAQNRYQDATPFEDNVYTP